MVGVGRPQDSRAAAAVPGVPEAGPISWADDAMASEERLAVVDHDQIVVVAVTATNADTGAVRWRFRTEAVDKKNAKILVYSLAP